MHAKKVCKKFAALTMAVVLGTSSILPAYAAEEVPVDDVAITQETEAAAENQETEAPEDAAAVTQPEEADNSAGTESAGDQEEEVTVIDGYFVFVPGTENASFSYDNSRKYGEELDGYSILMYDSGETVSIGAEMQDGYTVTAYDWNSSVVGSEADGTISFAMPASDVILVVEEQESAGEAGDALASAIGSISTGDGQQEDTEAPAQTEESAETNTDTQTEAPVETDTADQTEAPVETDAADQTEAPVETDAADQTEAPVETDAADQTEAVEETDAADQTEVPVETDAAVESEAEETGAESETAEEADLTTVYPEKGSVVEVGSFQLWNKDTGFDYKNFRVYDDENVSQAYKDGEVNFEEEGTYRISYVFSLVDDPEYSWEGIVEFDVDPDKDLATAKSDEFDNIVGTEIKQSGDYEGIIPDTMDGVLEGPHYTVKLGNTDFDLEKLNLDYHPDEFNMILKDDGGFDVNTVGDYHVQYNVSSKFFADYEWVVESVVSVVEPKAEGVTVYVKSQSIEVTAFDGDGNSLGTARDGQAIDCDTVKSLKVTSIMDKEIQPKLELVKNGEVSEDGGWLNEAETGEKECSYSLNLMNDSYEILVSDEIFDRELEKKSKTSSGWLSSELADMIVSIDGTKATLSDGTVIDITQPDEEIYGDLLDDDMELDDTIELYADSKVVSKSFAIGKFRGTGTCTNYGNLSTHTGWNRGTVTPTTSGFNQIAEWLLESNAPVTLEGKTPSDLKVNVSCTNPNGTKMGLPYSSRSSVRMTCTVYKTSKDTYYLKINASLSRSPDAQGSYQALAGSKKIGLELELPVPVKITKTFANPGLASYNPRLAMNTTFTIYDDPQCDHDSIVGYLNYQSATATSLAQEFEAEDGETYYVRETGRIAGCRQNQQTYKVTPKKDNPASQTFTVTNYDFEYAGLLLKKVDSENGTPIADAIFKVNYYSRNPDTQSGWGDFKQLGTFFMKTDSSGQILFDRAHYLSSFNGQASSPLPCNASGVPALTVGWLTFEEVEAPEEYVLNPTRTAPIELAEPADKTTVNLSYTAPTVTNVPANFSLQLRKGSSVNVDGNTHYSVKGATYELHSSDMFDESDYVATLVIGEDGLSNRVDDLSIDTTYYLKETKAPNNFEVDPTMYEITGTSLEQKILDLKDMPVMDGEVHLEKYVEEGTVNEGTDYNPKEGIKFKLAMKEGNDDFRDPFVTDKDGKIDISGLKYGTYTLTEMEAFDGYHLLADPITFTLDENHKKVDLTRDNGAEVNNGFTKPLTLRIEKRDKETNSLIVNRKATFQILDVSETPINLLLDGATSSVDKFPMDENGIILFAENCGIIGGKYTLVEIECPKGYQKAPDVNFEITAADKQKTVTVTMNDEAIKGELKVTKIDKVTGLNCGAGFRFNVISVDDKMDSAGNIYNGFGKDEICATITTDENGVASTGDILYEGKYYVQEVQSGEGYAINKTKYPFEIKLDGKTPEDAVNVEMDIANDPTGLKILKVDEFHSEKALEGVTFRIKAEDAEDSDDQLYTTDEKGEISVSGLKHDTVYTVQEVKTIPGYNLDTCIHKFGVDGNGLVYNVEDDENPCTIKRLIVFDDWGESPADSQKGFRYEYTLSNRPNRLQVTKSDVTNGKEIAGAQMKLTRISSDEKEENSEVVDEWTSDGTPHIIDGLAAGKYRLTEIVAPELYEVAESIEFDLKDSMDVQKVEMKDAPYRDVEVSKTDITDGKEIEGATLQILDAENKIVEEWMSGADGKTEDGAVLPHMVKLPSGVYTLKETIPAPGFVTAASIVFEVKQRNTEGDVEVQKVHMEDDITTLTISKKDITNSEELPGAHLVIKDKDGKVVEEWISTDEPHVIKKIPIGEYTLTETTAPDGYEVAETISFSVTDTNEIQHVEMFDSPYREIVISKTDLAGTTEIEGAELRVTDMDGNVVEEWTSGLDGTDEEGNILPHTFSLPSGKYTLIETKPADGYVTAESIDFTVAQTTATDFEVQSVQMFDDTTKIEISKQDVTTEKELPGAKLEIKNEDGEVVEEWTSTREPHYIEMLPIGDYTLTETTAPEGYDVAETVEFTVKDTGEIQHVVMFDSPKPTGLATPQTGDTFPLAKAAAVAGTVIVLLGAGFLLIHKKKKH